MLFPLWLWSRRSSGVLWFPCLGEITVSSIFKVQIWRAELGDLLAPWLLLTSAGHISCMESTGPTRPLQSFEGILLTSLPFGWYRLDYISHILQCMRTDKGEYLAGMFHLSHGAGSCTSSLVSALGQWQSTSCSSRNWLILPHVLEFWNSSAEFTLLRQLSTDRVWDFFSLSNYLQTQPFIFWICSEAEDAKCCWEEPSHLFANV